MLSIVWLQSAQDSQDEDALVEPRGVTVEGIGRNSVPAATRAVLKHKGPGTSHLLLRSHCNFARTRYLDRVQDFSAIFVSVKVPA